MQTVDDLVDTAFGYVDDFVGQILDPDGGVDTDDPACFHQLDGALGTIMMELEASGSSGRAKIVRRYRDDKIAAAIAGLTSEEEVEHREVLLSAGAPDSVGSGLNPASHRNC